MGADFSFVSLLRFAFGQLQLDLWDDRHFYCFALMALSLFFGNADWRSVECDNRKSNETQIMGIGHWALGIGHWLVVICDLLFHN